LVGTPPSTKPSKIRPLSHLPATLAARGNARAVHRCHTSTTCIPSTPRQTSKSNYVHQHRIHPLELTAAAPRPDATRSRGQPLPPGHPPQGRMRRTAFTATRAWPRVKQLRCHLTRVIQLLPVVSEERGDCREGLRHRTGRAMAGGAIVRHEIWPAPISCLGGGGDRRPVQSPVQSRDSLLDPVMRPPKGGRGRRRHHHGQSLRLCRSPTPTEVQRGAGAAMTVRVLIARAAPRESDGVRVARCWYFAIKLRVYASYIHYGYGCI
jgi:hypothetical protein